MKELLKKNLKKFLLKISPIYRKINTMQQDINYIKVKLDSPTLQINQLQTMNNNTKKALKILESTRNMMWFSIKDNTTSLKEAQSKFWSNYPMLNENMRILQTGNMFILQMLKKICDDNNLKFWLHGGTLIGAIRTQKCIPWDDDVDVAMMRADLNKLIKYTRK